MTSDQEGTMQKILQLWEFKTYVESLNEFFLRKKIGGCHTMVQWPKVNKQQRLKVVVCTGRSNNGCHSTRCQAVWHAVHPRDFQSLFTSLDAKESAIHFVKKMLKENEWMDCMPGNCLLHCKNKRPCPMPMQQFCCDTMITSHIQRHNVPVFQVEVAREKGTQKQDDRKICLTSSWNLCYTSRAYGMEVGKDSATIIKMEKNRKSAVIECSKFQVDLNGSGTSGKIFKQLLKVLGLIKVDLHASCRRNQKCMMHAPPYLGLAKLTR